MEFRVLQYFLALTKYENISSAAESLHLTQPTLSRQLKDMEDELGRKLFIRGNRKITLTDEGMILKKRAEEIVELYKKTQDEIAKANENIKGEIYIGAAETEGVRFLAKTIAKIQKNFPLIHTHLISGDRATVIEQLDRGLIDFGLVFGNIDKKKYDFIKIPYNDVFGVLMRRDSELASKDYILKEDLINKPLIISRQSVQEATVNILLDCDIDKLNIVATYNLLFNGSILVEEGIGYALCLDKIINICENSNLCFKRISNQADISLHLIWKKNQTFTKSSEKFLIEMSNLQID